MKSVKVFTLIAALMVIVVFVGCSTTDKAKDIALKSTAKVETIEHKGTAFGIENIPPWLSTFIQRNGTRSVEELPDYKGKYVIIGQANGAGLQQVETWAKNFDAQQQIGATIESRVASVFKAHENLLPGDADAKRKYDNAINTLVRATYTGAKQEADWWLHQKITEKGTQPETRYTSFVLYTIDKTVLDQQIRDEIKKIKDNESPELAAAFDAVTKQLLERGLDWE
jgi:RNA-splicing ligase RtcB